MPPPSYQISFVVYILYLLYHIYYSAVSITILLFQCVHFHPYLSYLSSHMSDYYVLINLCIPWCYHTLFLYISRIYSLDVSIVLYICFWNIHHTTPLLLISSSINIYNTILISCHHHHMYLPLTSPVSCVFTDAVFVMKFIWCQFIHCIKALTLLYSLYWFLTPFPLYHIYFITIITCIHQPAYIIPW